MSEEKMNKMNEEMENFNRVAKPILKNKWVFRSGWCGSLAGVSFCEPRSCGFDPSWGVWERQPINVSLPFSLLSFPSL